LAGGQIFPSTATASGTYGMTWPNQAITNAVPLVARPLDLADVRLTGGPLKHAQDLDAAYLLGLEPDRMLYYFFVRAGLKPKAEEGYGGWDGGGRNLTGHIAGHYLSAVSLAWAATGDPRFKERVDYMVAELKKVQDTYPDGYLGALENGKERFAEVATGNIRSGGFDLNGLWSPWYVQHKIYAGLRDAYRYAGNRTALEVEIKFAGWAASVVTNLSEAQDQKMLHTEFGGMNEVMADLYADTGDKQWLALSDKFEDKSLIPPLARHEDILGGWHENAQIPKLIGDLKRHLYDGNKEDGDAAQFFWDQVVFHHDFATGGQGHDEYFFAPDKLNNIVNGRDAESCCAYNMLKMTRTLFALEPNVKYADYEERALFNHVLASIDPKDGRTCYMVPVGQGVQHEYQDMQRDFTCCVGSGMEDFELAGDGIYYESGDKLWINLYAPSTAHWKTQDATIEMKTDFPEGESVTLELTLAGEKTFALALRRPAWAGDGFTVKVNGDAVSETSQPDTYVELRRAWKNGDTVTMTLPKALHQEALADNPRRAALMWGPLTLAGDLGPEERRGGYENHSEDEEAVPVFVAAEKPMNEWLKPVEGKPGTFRTLGVGQPGEVTFVPFYQLPERTYGIYWDLFTPDEWTKESARLAEAREQRKKLQLATVSYVQPGLMQSERDFNEQGENSHPDRVMGRAGRRGRGWFSFDLPVDTNHPMALNVTYYSDEWQKRTFDILVNGESIGQQVVEKRGEPRFFDVEYKVPANLVAGNQKVTVKFKATNGNEIAAVYGIRMIRADAAR
jgi:DUF1680 family protein